MEQSRVGRNSFYSVKGWAIISVIIAHANVLNSNSIKMELLSNKLLQQLGLLGVPLFLFLSGYFYYDNNDRFLVLIKKKFHRIIVPWIMCVTAVFLLTSLTGRQASKVGFNEYVCFIVGYKSIYYYLTVLMGFYIAFYFMKNKIDAYLKPLGILNFLVILYYNFKVSTFSFINPLSWIIFFSLGLYCKKSNLVNRFVAKKRLKTMVLLVSSFILILLYSSYVEPYFFKGYAYFKVSSMLLELIGLPIFLWISFNYFKDNKFIIDLGRYSFSIYLIHLPIVGLINKIYEKYNLPFIVIKVIIAVIVIYVIFKVIDVFFNNKFKQLIGMR